MSPFAVVEKQTSSLVPMVEQLQPSEQYVELFPWAIAYAVHASIAVVVVNVLTALQS